MWSPLDGLPLIAAALWLLQELVMTSSLTSLPPPSPIVSRDVCQWHEFDAECEADEVVVMEHAQYGRMQLGSCVTEDIGGYLGCSADVLTMADRKCSGRHTCQIQIPDQEFESTQPCSQLQNYLEASYRCYPVQVADRPFCTSCDVIKLTSPYGYLASVVTENSGCGSADCPWLVEAGAGQTIQLRLFDFDYGADNPSGSGICRVYAVLKEELTMKSVTLCGGLQREQDVYRSETNSVEVRILGVGGTSSTDDRGHFMLHYQFMGCADIVPPFGASFSRDGDAGVVSCDVSGESVSLRCNGTKWIGQIPTCSDPGSPNNNDDMFAFNFSWGYSSILIIAIAVGIGACILIAGLLCYKRKSRPSTEPPPPLHVEPMYEVHGHGRPMELPYRESIDFTNTIGKNDTLRHHPADFRNEYTHIWERPLPMPKEPQHV